MMWRVVCGLVLGLGACALVRGRERCWRVEVCDDGRVVFEIAGQSRALLQSGPDGVALKIPGLELSSGAGVEMREQQVMWADDGGVGLKVGELSIESGGVTAHEFELNGRHLELGRELRLVNIEEIRSAAMAFFTPRMPLPQMEIVWSGGENVGGLLGLPALKVEARTEEEYATVIWGYRECRETFGWDRMRDPELYWIVRDENGIRLK